MKQKTKYLSFLFISVVYIPPDSVLLFCLRIHMHRQTQTTYHKYSRGVWVRKGRNNGNRDSQSCTPIFGLKIIQIDFSLRICKDLSMQESISSMSFIMNFMIQLAQTSLSTKQHLWSVTTLCVLLYPQYPRSS